MSEKLRQIKFSGFRGLPNYTCDLKGRNLLVCSGNGKGKSAIVDGLEFFFGGSVYRFHGEGTGNINHDTAVRHIKAKGPPSVEVSLVPANETLVRKLGADIAPSPKKQSAAAYVAACSEPGSFILRRAQILRFIESQDSERYQRLVELLGLRSIHSMQETFVQASQEARRRADTARTRYQALLRSYEDRATGFSPTSLQSIRDHCKQLLDAVGITVEASPEGLTRGDAELEKRRSPETRKRLDAIALAVGSLSVGLDERMQVLVEDLRTAEAQLADLAKESPEAEQLPVVNAGYDYFLAHEALAKCPLCEQPLLEGYAHVFTRLKSRREALGRLSDARRAIRGQLDQLITSADRTASRLGEDLRHSAQLDSGVAEFLEQSRESLVEWAEALRTKRDAPEHGPVELPECLGSLQPRRTIEADRLKAVQSKLTSQQNEAIETASSLLKRYIQNEGAVLKAESASADTSRLATRAEAAEQAFTKSRENALRDVLSRMADTVLDYYIRLHDVDGAECTKVEFLTTGRARAGGLRFVIDFLNSASGTDPRAYLSEGHLDSLGLCLYLATAKLFNRPGMPLVLDDVLTSADREHRHRVADLLLEEFGEFQLIVTTHDERWFGIFQDKAAARGEQQGWRFQRIANWSVETGPESAVYEGTWAYIDAHLDEDSYRELGGSLRLVLEDFMKRVAEKIELEVRYRRAANYTTGDFLTAGLVTNLRSRLLDAAPQDESIIKKELARAFGDEDLINFLSHDNPGRLEVTLQQTKDFVEGLQELTKLCSAHKLIKGITV